MNTNGDREHLPDPWSKKVQPQDIVSDSSENDEETHPWEPQDEKPFWQPIYETQTFANEISIGKRKKSPLLIILGIVTATLLLVLGISVLTTPRSNNIRKWVRDSNHEKLEKFLAKRSGWLQKEGKKADVYVLALTEALKLDQDRYEKVFLQRFNQIGDWQRVAILGELASSELQPKILTQVLASYKTGHYLDLLSNRRYDISDSNFERQLEHLKVALSKHQMEVADSILVFSVRNNLEENNLGIIRENVGLFVTLDNGEYPVFSRLVEEIETLSELETWEAEVPSERNRINRNMEDAKKELVEKQNEVSKSFVLNCWIVALADQGYYEIELNPLGFLYGNKQRALLKTLTFDYTTRGKASIRVIRLPNENVILKEKYGGFRQNWPVYKEDTAYYENLRRINTLQEDISSYLTELQNLDRSLSEAQEEIQRLHEEIINLANNYINR